MKKIAKLHFNFLSGAGVPFPNHLLKFLKINQLEFLLTYSQELANSLSELKIDSFSNIHSISIDCRVLPRMGEERDCRFHSNMSYYFTELMKIESPALYWFEITSKHTAQDLYSIIPTLNSIIDRSVPAYRKGFNSWDSKILYVGKVKSKLTDRMVVHFGYGRDKRTQGLQLCHWASELNLQLKFNYIILPSSLIEMAGIFEVKLAKYLKPIFGRHK